MLLTTCLGQVLVDEICLFLNLFSLFCRCKCVQGVSTAGAALMCLRRGRPFW